jgi:hypothetical protein
MNGLISSLLITMSLYNGTRYFPANFLHLANHIIMNYHEMKLYYYFFFSFKNKMLYYYLQIHNSHTTK